MQRYIVTGGARLEGSVDVSGAKNAALPILAASLLSDKTCVISNVPILSDTRTMLEVLKRLGVEVNFENNRCTINSVNLKPAKVDEELMRKMRASSLVLGPLLSRLGHVRMSYPGGCSIGSRPIDLHLKGLRKMGARIEERHGYLEAKANKLKGTEIYLDFPSVGATENIMMAAVLAEGTTIIRNAAREPEIIDLQNFLNSMGAKIEGAGSGVIVITGVNGFVSAEHRVIPDRIEAATLMIGAAITKGNVLIKDAVYNHLEPVIAKLQEAGLEIIQEKEGIRVIGKEKIYPIDVKTLPYPGFPTDVQPQIMALLALADGTSIVTENVFDGRFKHVNELRRMGANIQVEGRVAIIKGTSRLTGAIVEATDLRAGAALVLAGLAAEGVTVVEEIEHIERGYEGLEVKLATLGAQIKKE
ncbi:MAG TPA: UDP-N-acetylglucosamine 1-carboxyvinyltransferase [Clostridia bacterium]|nr:UDP-N-acetylglucosamine 1-carboxyvinyltransferase [Clostridia bacterium]